MTDLTVSVLPAISAIDAAQWDGCGAQGNPFVSHRFLAALEASASVGQGTGWHPRHLVARRGDQVVGVAPCYLKTHSQGEYIFDHAWAQAYERAGGRYYPKLQAAVPFTPVTGPRLIAPDPQVRLALLQAMVELARQGGLSGAHVTFCTQAEAALGAQAGFLPRTSEQFHWLNRGYAGFDDFLAQLSSRKRKAIRKERAQAQGFGGRIRCLTGDQIQPRHWDDFWLFYQDTGSRKWGRPYLTRAFFDLLHQTMRDDCLLILAERDGRAVAGALNLIGKDALYGRYWGCIEDHPFLHFELCYHQAIDWAIAHGLSRVEAGAQGEHKLARGYLPVPIHSLHWLHDQGFHDAVADFLRRERAAVDRDMALLTRMGPFRRDQAPV
ncbi:MULTISPECIES: GNAT family N-acetyltransferase [unclassified Paracoccus (in: a-proteobacteria)]|uniref:GNAT family N-acetyltransferase n=1 Tax=unclassified Paracoccus (in: a-proteobacteria) TaxID=2688777 RepID=UPI001E582F58|nr:MULTISPECIES: GNAT family N-acetyltransferase [unclassified Paracoccus (in: a-proteobacteria)]UXU75811.1 GNAT family N-acetyltransferase [Paracoccus sp. SMMA_5]UXU81720.1 GNAT family N-acetyltransferase [Paracoccus sp. SMMA_5_TC]